MPGIYGGDDVSAIVLDAGTSTFRGGWAGDDAPRAVVPTSYSWLPSSGESADADGDEAMDGKTAEKKDARRRFVGEQGVAWREGAELDSPLQDGMVTSPEAYLAVAQHMLTGLLSARAEEHPLLLTEPAWATRESREQMAELAFEQMNAPAFYLANATVCSSFAAGKPTSLLLDVGASHASAIPVVDGFVLRKGIRRAVNLGGDAVSRALLYDLSTSAPSGSPRSGGLVSIVPQYNVRAKAPVGAGAPAAATLRDRKATDSYNAFARMRVLHEAKESLAQVLDLPWDEAQATHRPARSFEFPDGYNDQFGIERFRAPEVMFTPQLWTGKGDVLPSGEQHPSIPQIVLDAIAATDVDSRPTLLQNIVCVGGGTCIPGFNDRLSYQLGVAAPGQKIKIHSPGNTVERRYSAWLGGSILASLGTFHQLWISKQEYEEHGAAIVHARCR